MGQEQGPGHGGDERVRHGHRQARRAVRGPLLDLRFARKLLPGSRAGRTRRTAGLCPAARGVGRQRPRRTALQEGISAAGPNQGYLRTGLLLPPGRHRRRGRNGLLVQSPRLLRPAAPMVGHGRGSAQAPAAERLSDADRRAGEPRAHHVRRPPRRPLQTARRAQRSRPLHPHAPAPVQRHLHRIPPHRRSRNRHLERLHRRQGQGAAQAAVAAARHPLRSLEPLAYPLFQPGTAAARRPLHRPRDLPAAAGAAARTLQPHDRLRRQRHGVPQCGVGTLFRFGRNNSVRHLRPLPGAPPGRETG